MTSMTDNAIVVRQQRTIAAPPHRVYRAWLDPDVLSRWFMARDRTITRAVVDERVGGRHATYQVNGAGEDAGGFESELIELVPDERIVMVWRFCGPDRNPDPSHDSLLTVTFTPSPDGTATELSLVHERLDALAAAMPEMAGMFEAGWRDALDNLVAALAEAS